MTTLVEPQRVLSVEEIMNVIPHTFPFLLVDRVLSIDFEAKRIKAIKNVSINEPFFQGHFPGKPIMPGVLLIEALAQVGAIYISQTGIEGLKVLVGVKNFKFRRPVTPGDQLHLNLEVTHFSKIGGRSKGEICVDGKVCAEGEMTFSVIKEKDSKS